MTIAELIVTLFHASVLMLGALVLSALWKIHLAQRRIMEKEDRRDPVFRRVLLAAEDWYDDKPDSKRLLREAVSAMKLDPHHPALPRPFEERFIWYEGPYGQEEMKVEAHPLVWAEVDALRRKVSG